MAESLTESVALDQMEALWTSQGYTLVRQPERDLIPKFLGRYRPDAIATGKQPGLIIEVIDPRVRASATKVSQLQNLIAQHPEWQLQVIYKPSDTTDLAAAPRTAIAGALAQAELLAKIEPRAALMLAWASLEASGRARHPALADRSMSSGSLIDLLISNGDLEQSVQSELRSLGQMRNKIAHGQLDLTPRPQEVLRIVGIARSIQSAT